MSLVLLASLAASLLATDPAASGPERDTHSPPLAETVRRLEERVARLERAVALRLLDPQMRAVRGSWRVEGDRLVSPSEGDGILQLPYQAPSEYVLTMRVRRIAGNNTFAIGTVAGHRQVLVALDAHESTVSGLEHLDGQYVHENEAASRRAVFAAGRESEVVCVVRRDRITCVVDDLTVVDWQGDFERLSIPETYAVPDARALSVVTLNTSYEVRDVRLAPLGLPGLVVE